jgi:hypothetical protein
MHRRSADRYPANHAPPTKCAITAAACSISYDAATEYHARICICRGAPTWATETAAG